MTTALEQCQRTRDEIRGERDAALAEVDRLQTLLGETRAALREGRDLLTHKGDAGLTLAIRGLDALIARLPA